MAKTATACLRQKLKQDVAINIDTVVETQQTGFGNGSGIIVIAHTSSGYRLAGSALGKRDSTAEQVGEEAANFLLNNLQHNECVDEHLQDQVSVAKNSSTWNKMQNIPISYSNNYFPITTLCIFQARNSWRQTLDNILHFIHSYLFDFLNHSYFIS